MSLDLTSPTTIFVTGGTGFIGTNLVNALVARGHTVRCLTRTTSNTDGLSHERISFVEGNTLDRASIEKGMKGCSQVYHVAGYTKNWAKDPQEFFRQNVDGMQNVFDVARSAGVQRIVFTSTIVTLGPSPPGEVRDESMPRITHRYYTTYEESKIVAERKAMDQAAAGLPVVIVNPTRVYGPGKLTEGNSVSLMIDMYDRGKVPVLLDGGVDVGNYAFVDDLVEGQILAMERGRIGEQYVLGGENASLKEIFRLVDEVSGKKHLQFKLPPRVALLFGAIEEIKANWLGIYPQITPPWVETFLQDWAYTCGKAERELGYRITPLREGIRRTYEWILDQRKKR